MLRVFEHALQMVVVVKVMLYFEMEAIWKREAALQGR